MAEEGDGERGGGWLSKYGIPGILASIVVFAFQQQQQTFDRLQDNLQTGYQYYSSNRTQLQSSEDADRELALLKIVSRIFPNIYCDLREDLYQRVLAAQNADVVKAGGIDTADLELLRSSIMAQELDHPKSQLLPTNVVEAAMPHFGPQAPKACPALNQAAPAASAVAQAAPAPSAAPAPAATPSAAGPDTAATSAAAAAPGAAAPTQSAGLSAARSGIAQAARDVAHGATASLANQPRLTPSASTMRVFFHISAGGRRDGAGQLPWANQARLGLAPYNYRVVRGVQRINPGDFPSQPEIRYFGAAEAPAAEQLAAYLNWQFRDEGLQFRLNAIGARFPNLPHENMEVWLPEPRS